MKKLDINNFKLVIPELGGTSVIIQRHAEDFQNRPKQLDSNELMIGDLMMDSEKKIKEFIHRQFEKTVENLSHDERQNIDILVVASDPRISVRNKEHTESLRNIKTAEIVLMELRRVFDKFNLNQSQILNDSASFEKGVVEISEIKSPLKTNDYPGLGDFLLEKADISSDAIENVYAKDDFKDEREIRGVESRTDITERMRNFLAFVRGAPNYHQKNPNRRLIFWTINNFDILNPYIDFISKDVRLPKEVLLVDYLSGFQINIKTNGQVCVLIDDKEYESELKFPILTFVKY